MSLLAEEIRSVYGVNIPFYDGPLQRAEYEAQSEVKYLVIYLHCPTHESTRPFVKSVLGSDEVIAHLAESVVLYGASVMEAEGWQLANDFGVTTFPAVVAVFKKRLVMRLQGPYSREEFLHEWATCTELWDGSVAEEVSYRHERESRELERVQEELAVSAMEQADIERLAQLERDSAAREAAETAAETERAAAEEEARRQAEAQRMEEARRVAEELERKKTLARETEGIKARLPPEPPADAAADTVALISVRALSGRQYQRRFLRTDRVDAIVDFALTAEEHDGSPVTLVTGFPPSVLEWEAQQTTIGEVRTLYPRAVVTMRRASSPVDDRPSRHEP